MAQLPPLDRCARPPALAVDDLFIGQHRHVDGVPVDRTQLARHQAARQQVEKQRLLVPVILGLAGREFAAPVESKAQPVQLCAHRRDVAARPVAGMDAALDRGVLGGHAEGVPAHRMEHFEALRAAHACHHVAHRVVADVPHVDAPRRIGEHLEDEGLGAGTRVVGAEGRGVVPRRLPARLGRLEVEPRHRGGD